MTRVVVQLNGGETELRAETYLIQRYGISKSQWKRVKHTGDFRCNGAPAHGKHTIVHTGDVLTFTTEKPPNPAKFPVVPEHVPLDIRYEDDDLLAINKPIGMLVHPLYVHPNGTLANAILGYYEENGLPYRFHPLHRLDRDTTGLVLIAKRPELQHMLTKNGTIKLFHRGYLAIACGKLPERDAWIDAPLGRKPGSTVEQAVVPVEAGGKPARTHYVVVDECAASEAHPALSLVRLELETGRTHQIRVHLASLGCPLLGDDLYGAASPLIARQALHAERLTFCHPITKEDIVITAPPPADFQRVLAFFGAIGTETLKDFQ